MKIEQKYKSGDPLIGFERIITKSSINKYAEASGDYNPVHIDPAYASKTQFGGIIAHGMLSMAFIGELMTLNFPDTWYNGAKIKVRFKSPVLPGETLSVFGNIASITDNKTSIIAKCNVTCRKRDGTIALAGTISLPIFKN